MGHTRTQSSRRLLLPKVAAGQVRVLTGPARGEVMAIGATPLVIGSGEGASLVLDDGKVSRKHCEVRLGARGFLVKDLGSRNGTFFEGSAVHELAVPPGAILRVGSTHLALSAVDAPATATLSDRTRFGGLQGASLPMRRAFRSLERAALSDAPVLLVGETGTGKELAARGLHAEGERRDAPFVVVDCAAASAELLRDALFGHQRGAFTGAVADVPGALERANGGTVLFDAIEELPLELQPLLLRAAERHEVTRAGASKPVTVDVRWVAATRGDLASLVVEGRFREDLYHRLAVLEVALPPLRARKEDLPALIATLAAEVGLADVPAGSNLAALVQHGWPGNVRELRNVLARAASGAPLSVTPAKAREAAEGTGFHAQRKRALQSFERGYLEKLLVEQQGNLKAASRESGIERTQLKRLLERYGISRRKGDGSE